MFDPAALHIDLQRQQQSEKEFVLFIQASCCIFIYLKGHELDDVGNAFAGDRAFGGPVQVEYHDRYHRLSPVKYAVH